MLKVLFIVITVFAANIACASEVKGDINLALSNLCSIVIADDSSELENKIKQLKTHYRLKLRQYYHGISCKGQSLIRTALLNDAEHTAELLIQKLPKMHLLSPESDGKTLQQWIDEKHLDNSPTSDVLFNKINT